MNNENVELRKVVEREFRNLASVALYNNLYWWASGSQEINKDELQKALWLMDKIL